MNIPFLSYFKKKAKPEPAAEKAAPAPLEKPSSERLSKTVMPSASRMPAAAPERSFDSGNGGVAVAAAAPAPAAVVPRTVSFGANGSGNGSGSAAVAAPSGLPPAVALALEPRVERAISIDLADVIAQMPEGMVRPIEDGDASRRVLLKAAELERGMANGKPMVSIATIYQQVPEIFLRPIEASETGQVHLPFQKVLEQFTTLQTRSDQYRDQAVPQVETPFLRVALEDGTQFGTPLPDLETSEPPPVRLEPATAESLAAAEPEPAAQAIRISVPGVTPAPANGNGAGAPKPFSLRMPAAPAEEKPAAAPAPAVPSSDAPAAPASDAPPAAPARIPFKLSPNGTDAPATESVPASGGPSVPTSEPAAPARIPFKLDAPAEEETRPKAEPWLTADTFQPEAEAAPAADGSAPAAKPEEAVTTVSLPLKPIFHTLRPDQLKGEIDDMPGGVRVKLPFAIIEPQLALGRIAVTPEQFAAALPEDYRPLFDETVAGSVALPLHEVLKNLPAATLRMRDDQEEQEKGANFATPFSAKAEEDAKRFNVAATPVPKQVVPPVAETAVEEPAAAEPAAPAEPAAEAPAVLKVLPAPAAIPAPAEEAKPGPVAAPAKPEEPATATTGSRTALQELFDTDEELDAKTAVAHVGRMPGVKACALMFGDGLSLAGDLPAEYDAEGLCAMAPSMLQRVENHLTETKLGGLRGMTLSCEKASITFFMHDNLCLAAQHAQVELTGDVRVQLTRVVQELSRKYSHPV